MNNKKIYCKNCGKRIEFSSSYSWLHIKNIQGQHLKCNGILGNKMAEPKEDKNYAQ